MERKATGRPSKYTEALVAEICDRVANGTPLREICREDDKPTWSTFYDWIRKDESLFTRFTYARELGTDAIAEDALAIIDTIPERLDGGGRRHVVAVEDDAHAAQANHAPAPKAIPGRPVEASEASTKGWVRYP
jgi:hypothetical protein